LDKDSFADFWPLPQFKLTNPLSMELAGPAQQMLGMGYFKFKDTNVSISAGPHSAKSLIEPENPEFYEAQRDIAGYLNNLLTNNVAHVFAMGRVFPYYPQDGIKTREIIKDQTLEQDFINYFIPDANGRVTLPDIPELKDLHITSHPIQKVGRFLSYEISINGSNPIQVHHFPIRDKQPLELTLEELAYVKEIGKKTPSEQNTHTHCRGGKGRSAQIAYLLASLHPKYGQLTHDARLAQMRVEKTTSKDSMSFIETPFQKDYIGETGYLIHEDMASHEDENLELYIIYGTLLKQEIDKLIQQIGMPGKIVDDNNRNLVELMEKYQELSSLAFSQLNDWVVEVSRNSIIAAQTKTLLSSNDSTDFLLRAFKEHRDPVELGLFFDLQASSGSYTGILDKLASIKLEISEEIQSRKNKKEITDEQAQREELKLEKYESLFVVHVQDAYLKNLRNVDITDRIQLKLDVHTNISEAIRRILVAVVEHNPKKFTKEEFESLKKEYYQYKQRIELLENAEANDDYKVLDAELKQFSELAEQLFILGYDDLELEPLSITTKMELLYQQLGKLSSTNELSPEKWDELKNQYTALKIIFNFKKSEEMEAPAILSTLNELFQGKREHTENLFKWEVLQVKPNRENLADFVAGLGMAVLEAAFDKLPGTYFGDHADGIYSKEINQLIDAIAKLADTYKKPAETGVINLQQQRKTPTQEEYEKARQQVVELISKHVPFLISTMDFRVQFENLHKDFLRLESHFQVRTPEFKELKKRFAELKTEYQMSKSQQDNEFINQLIDKIETKMKTVVDIDEEEEARLAKSIENHYPSKENALRVKAMSDAVKSGSARETQDDIDYILSSVEKKEPKGIKYPKQPKLIVFDVDDTLIDLNKNELKRAVELISVLKYAKKHGMEVALATNRTPGLDAEEATPIAKLKTMINDATGIDISTMLTFLETPSMRLETETIFRYGQEKIPQLKKEIELLNAQMPDAEDKNKLAKKIEKLQQQIDYLDNRLISGKFSKLDSIRRHYHVLKNLTNYYQNVEGGVLLDFKNPELTKNIGISDFIEKQQLWTELFKLAEVLMQSKSLKDPKPSLQAILKDLIFDADKPKLLQRKYGDLNQWHESIQNINKEYFIQHLPEIESFYQSRLVAQKLMYERRDALNEEDILFLDDNQSIINQTRQNSNYRAIKVSDAQDDSFRYMVEFNYEMGAYNGVIAYLNGDIVNAPSGYGKGSINKTLTSLLK
jgi:hydroxymethylpyrimidine pyrophosphatase-like HAD family hydrolase